MYLFLIVYFLKKSSLIIVSACRLQMVVHLRYLYFSIFFSCQFMFVTVSVEAVGNCDYIFHYFYHFHKTNH